MDVLDEIALAVSVMEVALFIERTVPITALPASFKIFPTLTCVRKLVPVPVMMGEPEELLMFPKRVVLGHAVALQFPEAMAVMVMAEASSGNVNIKRKRKQKFRPCKIVFMRIFVQGFQGQNQILSCYIRNQFSKHTNQRKNKQK